MFDLSVDTLRYYERVGVIPPVHRNESDYRNYTTNDLNWIYLAKNLRNAGLSIESLIEFAQLAQLRETQNVEKAQKQEREVLPELTTTIPDFDKYERIFLGTPTWNMALSQAVVSFLDSYDFNGKTIIPFNTHGGYGAGSTFSQISANTKGANVLEGYTVKGGEETKGLMLIIKRKSIKRN